MLLQYFRTHTLADDAEEVRNLYIVLEEHLEGPVIWMFVWTPMQILHPVYIFVTVLIPYKKNRFVIFHGS